MKESPYYVWRRGDGYVGCTRYEPRSTFAGGCEVLLVTHDWPEARARILTERDKRHDALVASWKAEEVEVSRQVEQAILRGIQAWQNASLETITRVVMQAIPDGWAKIDGRWKKVEKSSLEA